MTHAEAYKKYTDRLKNEIVSNCPVLDDVATIIYDYICPDEIEHFIRVIATNQVTGTWKQDACEYSVKLRSLGDEFIHFTGQHRYVYNVELAEELLMFGLSDEIRSQYISQRIEGMLIHSAIRYGCANHSRNDSRCDLKSEAVQHEFATRIAKEIMLSFAKAADTL